MAEVTLEQVAVSDHDCPAAHQPYTEAIMPQVAAGRAQLLPCSGAPPAAAAQRYVHGFDDVCIFPHCKCANDSLCPEVRHAQR